MGQMVGRDQELAEALRSLADPEVAVTLVLGDAGIGKSRLAAEVVSATPTRLTLAGGCLPMGHALPLLPLVDALDTRDASAHRALVGAARSLPTALRPHLAGVMPRTLPEEVEPAEEVSRDQLFLACEALLSRVAEERPLTVLVEDIHWADADTLDLLTYLAGARHTRDLGLLITCRTDETEMTEPVAGWLDTQRRSAGVHEVRLGPLDAADVRRVVAGLPRPEGSDLDSLAAAVFARAEGNPFFTEQLVASAGQGERLPDRLAKLLSARVRTVSPAAQDAVTALAVLGRPVPVGALGLATGEDEQGCLAAVREAEAASLVARDQRGVRPRHALLAEAVLEELPGVPAAYHRRIATALESIDDPSTVPEVAEHLRLAGDERAELQAAQRAAQRAWDLGAYTDAARWYRRVSELHAIYPEEPLTLAEVDVVRRTLRALDLGGARREATILAERALGDFAEWPDTAERLALLTNCADLVAIEDGERGKRLLEGLLPQYEGLPPSGEQAVLLDRLSSAYNSTGESRTGLTYALTALDVAQKAGDLTVEAHAAALASGCSMRLGDREGADRFAADALRVAERSGDALALLHALIFESDSRLKYAEYEAASDAGERGIEVAYQNGLQRSFQAHLLVSNAAEAYLALGRTEEVGRLVDALTDRPLRPDDDVLTWLRAQADLRRGDPAGAHARLRGERAMIPHDVQFLRAETEALALVLLWNSRPDEALQTVGRVLPIVGIGDYSQDTGPLLSLGAQAVAEMARRGDGGSAAERLARLEEARSAMPLDPFADRATKPRASVDRRQWQAERGRAEGRSDPDAWIEAAQGWERLSMPHDAAYCWWRAAEALLAGSADKHQVRTSLHAAYRLAEGHLPLRGEVERLASRARIPIVDAEQADGDDAPESTLTEQETRVLRLLARGLTNSEIGTALFISPKTASVHVSNILRKLQVTNRTEAAAWATRHGLTEED